MAETFKTIVGFPNYEIGDEGTVYSKKSGKVLKPSVCKTRGRLKVNLLNNGKRSQTRVHRLVADHFLGPPPFPSACVRHLNDIPSDNRKANLEWGTHADNMQDKVRNGNSGKGATNGNARLSEDQVRAIRASAGLHREIAERFDISPAQVARIKAGTRWSHVA